MPKAALIHQELRIARIARATAARPGIHGSARAECLMVARQCLATARRFRLAA
jgi:hypothetical protein